MKIKGPLKVKIEGVQGSGKTTLLYKIKEMLEKEGFTAIHVNDVKHTLDIQKGE